MMGRDIDRVLTTEFLSPRQIDILKFRFGFIDGYVHTLDECANRYNVTRERARQIEAKAMRLIRWQECRKFIRGYVDPDYEPVRF